LLLLSLIGDSNLDFIILFDAVRIHSNVFRSHNIHFFLAVCLVPGDKFKNIVVGVVGEGFETLDGSRLGSDGSHIEGLSLHSWSPGESLAIVARVRQNTSITIHDLTILIELVELLINRTKIVLLVRKLEDCVLEFSSTDFFAIGALVVALVRTSMLTDFAAASPTFSTSLKSGIDEILIESQLDALLDINEPFA
jgi:hypothetical protein